MGNVDRARGGKVNVRASLAAGGAAGRAAAAGRPRACAAAH
jgi:hypothetical protein